MKQQTLWDQSRDKNVPTPSDEVCGTCEFFRGGNRKEYPNPAPGSKCIITSRNQKKVEAGTPACNDYSEDMSNRPLPAYPLGRLGFSNERETP